MQLSDLAGVFSRHFVVGFFVPAFFALAAASLLLTPELLPNSYERYDAGTRLLILGGVSIPVGLLLQGFHPAVLSSLSQHRSGADWYRFVPSWLYRIMLKPQRASFDKMTRLSEDADAPLGPRLYALAGRFAASVRPRGGSRRSSEKDHTQAALRQWTQTTAAARLEERFPPDPDDLVPTELGNTLLATQHYAYVRWGLDTWVAWPRLEALLTEEERGSLSDRKAEVAFFLNGAIASAAVGGVLIVDAIWHSPIAGKLVVLYGLPFLLAYAFYRLSVGAAVRWGQFERAAVDLHRLELFQKMGLKPPRTYSDQYRLARAVNRFMLYRPPDASDATSGREELIRFSRSSYGEGFQPATDRDSDRFERLRWRSASREHAVWLETDCLLYGAAYATEDGRRIDPRNVAITPSGAAFVRPPAGFAAPSFSSTQPARKTD